MTTRISAELCRPPKGTKLDTWHILRDRHGKLIAAQWQRKWSETGWSRTESVFLFLPRYAREAGYSYVCPLDLETVAKEAVDGQPT